MMRYLTATLRLIFLLVVLTVAALSIYTYTSGNEIKNYLLKAINQQLTVTTDVQDVDISLIQNFPNLSLILKEVHMHQRSRSLIKAEEIRVKFSLFDLLDQNFQLHSLSIANGSIALIEDEQGDLFPKIWRNPTTEDSTAQKRRFELKLRKVSLSQIQLQYSEKNAATEFNLRIQSAWLKGNFGQDRYDISWNSKIDNFDFYKRGKPAFKNQSIRLESVCSINQLTKTLQIELLKLDWLNLKINGKGSLNYADQLMIKLQFEDQATSLSHYFPLLEKELVKDLDSLGISGNLKLSGIFNGELAPDFHPEIELNYEVDEGRYVLPKEKLVLQSLHAVGTYKNPDLSKFSNGEFKVDSLEAFLNKMALSGRMSWFTSNRFPIEAKIQLRGQLNQLNPLLDSLPVKMGKGSFEAKLDGYFNPSTLSSFDLNEWKSVDKSLYLSIKDGEILTPDSFPSFRGLNGEFALGRNDLYAKSVSFQMDEMSLNYEGAIYNLISFLDRESEPILVSGRASSPALDIDKILGLSNSAKGKKERRAYQFKLSLNGLVDQLNYGDFEMTDVALNVNANNSRWVFDQIRLKAVEGSAEGSLMLSEKSEGQWMMFSNSNATDLNVHQLFKAFNNFGQTEIKAENLEGKLSGNLELECEINEGKVNKSSLNANGFFTIDKGRLKSYQSLYQLAKYVQLEELKNIRFNRLQNDFRIKDERIYFPRFSVHSSAIDLEVEGTHDFDNQVDYQISLSLAQVLGRKVKKPKESDFGYIEDDGLGKTQLFLRMSGDISDPKISYDKAQLKDHWKKEARKEKQTIKSILKEEFGMFKKDSSVIAPREESKDKPAFQIEWGESDEPANPDERKTQNSEKLPKKEKKKGRFGKFIDKIAKPNEDEYVTPKD